MSLLQSIEDKVREFVLSKAVGNAVVFIAKGAASYALAHAGVLQSFGVSTSVDPNQLALAIGGVVHVGTEYLASKFPSVCGWMHTIS